MTSTHLVLHEPQKEEQLAQPSKATRQVLLLGAIAFTIQGTYEFYRGSGFHDLEADAYLGFEILFFALGSVFGGVLYHSIGNRVMLFLGFLVYGINIEIDRLVTVVNHVTRSSLFGLSGKNF